MRVLTVEPASPDSSGALADRDLLERGFRRLPPEQRALLVLRHYLGLETAEIAETLGIPEGTARSRLHLLPGVSGPGGPSPSIAPTASPRSFSSVGEGGTGLEPGAYVITVFPPVRIVIDVPAGWSKGRYDWAIFSDTAPLSVAFMTVTDLIADPCAEEPEIRVPEIGTSVDALITALEDTPGIEVGAPTSTTLDGRVAQRFDLTAPDGLDCGVDDPVLFDVPGLELFAGPTSGEPLPIWVVDVDGTRVVIAMLAGGAAPVDVAAAEAIIEGVRFD
jgi:hypothetical protein